MDWATVDGSRAEQHVDFSILGPLKVVVEGTEVPIATRRQRALMLLLLLNVGRVVPTERLIDQLWDGAAPPQAAVTLRSYVSNLRRALAATSGADSGTSVLASALTTRGQGYSLEVPARLVDAVRLSDLTEQGREHLRTGRSVEAFAAFDSAVGSWRGDPLAEIADHQAVQGTITQLTETYLGAVEGRFEALLATGRHHDALPGLEAFAREHPLREEPRALLMLALYRAGRAPDALELFRKFREHLADELGIDPSSRLVALNQHVLEQHPDLAAPAAATSPSYPATASAVPALGGEHFEPEPARPGRERPSLVGRDRELTVLRGHLESLVVANVGSLLLVAGEPGIGKTTLLESLEAEARSRGVHVHTGRAPAAAGAPAFWPWSQIVDSLAAGLDDDALATATAGTARPVTQLPGAVAARTGQRAGMTGDSTQTLRFLLYEAISSFITQATGGQPVVITLDDMHWADVPSLELLSYITPTLESRSVLVVAAYRDLPADRTDALDATLATVSREDNVDELTLSGLTESGVAELVDGLSTLAARGASTPGLARLLHERTGGNPFFVRQLARLLTDARPGANNAASTEAVGPLGDVANTLPPGVTHVIAQRLVGLDPTVTAFLEAAAIAGRDFEIRLVAAVAGIAVDDALDAYDGAARHGLVENLGRRGGRRFVHALVQEVVLARLSAGRAARLHAAVARQLENQPSATPEERAEHMWAAREVVGTDAVQSLLAAAKAAVGVYAHEQAEAQMRRALSLLSMANPPDHDAELDVLLGLFRLIASARGWGDDEVRRIVERAISLVGTSGCTDDTVHLWWSLFFYLLDRGDDTTYAPVARTLLASLSSEPNQARDVEDGAARCGDGTRAAIHLMAVFSWLADEDRNGARTHLRTARSHIEAAPNHELAAFDEHLHVMLLVIEATWAALSGDIEANRAAIQAAVALADADGRPFPRAVARTLATTSLPYLPDHDYALELAGQALEVDHRYGFSWLAAIAETVYAWADAHVNGANPEAAALLESRFEEVVVVGGHAGNAAFLLVMLAEVHVLDGNTDKARASLQRARRTPGPYRGLIVDVVDSRLAELP